MRLTLLFAVPNSAQLNPLLFLSTVCGNRVVAASNGIECLRKLREVSPDVLILDAELASGGNAGVLAMLPGNQDVSHVPVVLLASNDAEEDYSRSLGFPIFDCLRKPIDFATMMNSIRSASSIGSKAPMHN